ncbi:hypothetical protein [Thalassotalea euphylliae]|uniref:hypothetical protein n=1 Tax=Thalassotalea euphylliae TaxID=1655234 RepID=UPI0015F2584A|nr:hypothetical protein [Thalassotalea euphylliae]
MDGKKVSRLSLLFEKMVSEQANLNEQFELQILYDEFIEEGRAEVRPIKSNTQRRLQLA